MDNFKNTDSLNKLFKIGNVDIAKTTLTLDNVEFNLLDMTKHSLVEMKDKKAFMIFESANKEKWLVFIWMLNESLSVVPVIATLIDAPKKEKIEEQVPNIIPDTVNVKFKHFGKSIPSKIDSGANLSSLHVEHWKVLHGKNKVQFTSKMLSNNVIIMDLVDQVVVNTSEGSEHRPVVAFDINIEGKDINKAKFNLNDRSGMADPILIGQNVLEAGRFLIDPNRQKDHMPAEGVDWETLEKLFESLSTDGRWQDIYIQ